ncbi:conserved hypothetical protein [Ricinus communis]|uniref:Uncharacterized protein n=1 Tax=Ricinus communis TaxID=3988 RepID=B9RV28_RICCO|nr:conserved hypothetical protein [Ricinus communis]
MGDRPKLKKLPLNSNRTKIIELLFKDGKTGEISLEWEDEATRKCFSSRFQSLIPLHGWSQYFKTIAR